MDKYQKIKKIGEGSFGKALLVRHKENGKQFVIKEINMSKMGKKERDEARKETAVLAQLQHSNIVTYKESFEEIGNLYIVMDYCDGGDLYGRINAQRGILMPEEQIMDWFVQTCLAVKHIHDRKILHRDIKSQNIFLTRHGIVKLGDFGIAKVLNSTVELARTCIGTPYYLSPEICENKPYNNKSDVWSLGCVLYEMTTLKHAFEAGNMKNLVLKIIRGSYPPPAPRYSYELRGLINTLFKRNPRERPSINTVLRKPLLTARIKKFLSESEMADEFSHTVMHGVKLKKVLPPGVGGRPLPPKPVVAKVSSRPPSAVGANRYNPASVYAPSVARKSKDVVRKSADVRRSGGAKRPSGSAGSAGRGAVVLSDQARRRQELLERERKKKADEAYAKQHKEIVDKQRQQRIHKAREEGWRNLLSDSQGSTDSDQRGLYKGPGSKFQKIKLYNEKKSYEKKPASPAPKPNGGRGAGPYDEYNSYLDKLAADRKAAAAVLAPTPRDRPVSARDRAAGDAPPPAAAFDPVGAAMRGQQAGYKGNQAAEKARVISEFQKKSEDKLSYIEKEQRLLDEYQARKRQAAMYKARGQGDIFGVGAGAAVNPKPYKAPTPKPSEGAPKPSARPSPRPSVPAPRPVSARPNSGNERVSAPSRPLSARERDEQEYLARLKQIRLQNFNERRQVKDKNVAPKPADMKNDHEIRKKKIEALRAQADERAKRLKAELERKRLEAYDKEKRLLQAAKAKATPAVPITQALNAIGAEPASPPVVPKPDKCAVGMTAAMNAIGVSVDEEKQRAKEQILKRLNAKSVSEDSPAEKPSEPADSKTEETADKQDRPRWGEPAKPDVAVERSQWGNEGQVDLLAQMSLEETASGMEATHTVQIHVPGQEQETEPSSARRGWGAKPSSTVVNALHNVGLTDTVTSDSSVASDASAVSPGKPVAGGTITIHKPSELKAPAIGSTITIVKKEGGGTVVVRKRDDTDLSKKSEDIPTSSALDEKSAEEEDTKDDKDGSPVIQEKEEGTELTVDNELARRTPSPVPKPRSSPKPGSSPAKSRSPSPAPRSPKTDGSPKSNDSMSSKPRSSPRPQLSPKSKLSPKPVKKASPRSDEEKGSPAKEESKEQSPLFNKVDLDETAEPKEEDDLALEDIQPDEDESPRDEKESSRQKEKLLLGLTTGNFDIADVKMLRTCSEPDLAKLFRTNVMQNPFLAGEDEVAASVSVLEQDDDQDEEDEDIQVMKSYQKIVDRGSDDEDDDDEELGDMEFSVKDIDVLIGSDGEEDDEENEEEGVEKEEDGEEKNGDDNEDEEEAEDDSDEEEEDGSTDEADMETLRQSMMSILQQTSVSDEEAAAKKKKHSKARSRRREQKAAEAMKIADRQDSSDTSEKGSPWSARSVEDFQTMRDNMLSIVAASSAAKKLTTVKEGTDKTDATESKAELPTLNPDTEAWQSDEEEQDDDYWEEEDMFSRLEATRENLEKELGCEVFMKAYKTVQAIHEDEDDSMEQGLQLVSQILGPGKEHLYPSILQLVMADGVWTEDND